MDAQTYYYAESGGSSPRSRETDLETNPPQLGDVQTPPVPPKHKVKFMVSYGGKIQPRQHDNQLSYAGGHTKIIYVERSINFSSLISKLSSLISDDDSAAGPGSSLSSFKYQLPGEDLDSLISVSNDDDLQHLMHEYDRLYRASPKPVRFRLFLFPAQSSRFGSGSSDPGRDGFVEVLNSAPGPGSSGNKVDFLFGLDNKGPVQSDRAIGSDPQIEARIQELNRLQISGRKSDDNLAGESHQKAPPQPTIPASVQAPATYWQRPTVPPAAVRVENQQQPAPQQPIYVYHAPQPASVYHAPVLRPPTQGYYQVQRVPPDPVYREQPVYTIGGAAPNSVPPAPVPVTLPTPVKFAGYSEGLGLPVRPVAGLAETTGRQAFYATPGGVGVATTAFQAAPATATVAGGDRRSAGGLTGVDGKIVSNFSPTAV